MSELWANILPPGWTRAAIRELTAPSVEQGLPADRGRFVYVDISSIDNHAKRIVEPKLLSTSDAPSRAKQHLRPDDVLVSMTRPNLNAVAMVPKQMAGAIGSTGFHVLRGAGVHPGWLLYLVQTGSFVDSMSLLVQGALYPAIRPKDIASFVVPLAPLPEQRRIVEEIEKHFARLESSEAALKRIRANLKRYRAALLEAACEGRLVPTEAEFARAEGRGYEPAHQLLARTLKQRRIGWEADQLAKMEAAGKPPNDGRWKTAYREPTPAGREELTKVPEGWCLATVEQVSLHVEYGTSAKTSEHQGGVPVLRMGNILSDGRINLKELKFLPSDHPEFPRLLLKTGDLLFNRTNSAELVGKSAVYRGVPSPCSFASYLIRVETATGCDSIYLSVCLNCSLGRSWIKEVVSQQVGQANVNGSKLQAFVFPLPPLAEQRRIVAEVERRLSVIEELEGVVEANLKRAARLRQSILKRAFEGRLVAQDPNDEPASVLLERIRRDRAAKASGGERRCRRGRATNIMKAGA